MALGVMSLRSWQNIKEKPLEKQDWGSGESKGQEGLGLGWRSSKFVQVTTYWRTWLLARMR